MHKTMTPLIGMQALRGSRGPTRREVLGGMLAASTASLGLPRMARAADARISYVGWEGYDSAFTAGGFLEQNGAELDATYIAATEDIITRLRSGGMGTVDITSFNHLYNPLMGEAGLIAPVKTDQMTNFDKLLPQFRDMATEADGTCYGIPLTFSSCALLYNPAMVSAAPTSWKDFLAPEYKGKVALFSDALTNILVWAPVATGVADPTRLTKAQLDETVDLLITLKKEHVRAMPASLGDGAELLIQGEVAMIMGWEPMVIWCREKGVEVSIAKPEEGTWAFVDTLNIATDAPNADLDLSLIDHAISADAQAEFGNANLLGIVNAEAVGQLSPELQELYGFDNLDAYFEHAHIYPRMFPLEPEGDFVTYDQVLDGYDRFLRA
ncbi:ABC transporter substrate-binding protein [Salipiger abyssi]|uniref:ABC transporter substrate-binding protein n=1 Tax=Salipiger abyssi TaxID=1250539 RepID=UPI001A8D47AA|nr:extracellular solute-binding protein [Salipiger abyssi]MBN9887090.1 extracellular solute-binding protein [Salipiger abyssi]